jgi:hypothetical protein
MRVDPEFVEAALAVIGKSKKKMMVSMGFMDEPDRSQEIKEIVKGPGEGVVSIVSNFHNAQDIRGMVFVGTLRFPDVKYNQDNTVDLTFRSSSLFPALTGKSTVPPIPPKTNFLQAFRMIFSKFFLLYNVKITPKAESAMRAGKYPKDKLKSLHNQSPFVFLDELIGKASAAAGSKINYYVGFLPKETEQVPTIYIYSDDEEPEVPASVLESLTFGLNPVASLYTAQSKFLHLAWGEANGNCREIEFMKEEGTTSGLLGVDEAGNIKKQTVTITDPSGAEKTYKLNEGAVRKVINSQGLEGLTAVLATYSDQEVIDNFYTPVASVTSPAMASRRGDTPPGAGRAWKAKVGLYRGYASVWPGMQSFFHNIADPSKGSFGGKNWIVDSVTHRFDQSGFFTDVELTK